MLRPRLVVSACLLGDKVRYDGRDALSNIVLKVTSLCEVIKVCPEVEIGLGVPRDKLFVHQSGEKKRVLRYSDGEDITNRLLSFSRDFLSRLGEVDGFILKSKSPSCGFSGTKTYSDVEGKELSHRGSGLFADQVLVHFPEVPYEDERGLEDPHRRGIFLGKIWLHFLARTTGKESLKELYNIRDISYEELLRVLGNSPFKELSELP